MAVNFKEINQLVGTPATGDLNMPVQGHLGSVKRVTLGEVAKFVRDSSDFGDFANTVVDFTATYANDGSINLTITQADGDQLNANLPGNFVSKFGDTMTGTLNLQDTSLTLTDTASSASTQYYWNQSTSSLFQYAPAMTTQTDGPLCLQTQQDMNLTASKVRINNNLITGKAYSYTTEQNSTVTDSAGFDQIDLYNTATPVIFLKNTYPYSTVKFTYNSQGDTTEMGRSWEFYSCLPTCFDFSNTENWPATKQACWVGYGAKIQRSYDSGTSRLLVNTYKDFYNLALPTTVAITFSATGNGSLTVSFDDMQGNISQLNNGDTVPFGTGQILINAIPASGSTLDDLTWNGTTLNPVAGTTQYSLLIKSGGNNSNYNNVVNVVAQFSA